MMKIISVFTSMGEFIAKGKKVLFGVTEMFYILFVVIVTGAYSFVKTHETIYFKWAHCIAQIAYFSEV